MARIPRERFDDLTVAIRSQDYLRRVAHEIEELLRVVFHDNEHADWSLARQSAEQILIAEIVSRYHGQADGVYYALRAMEDGGKQWDVAIRDLAAAMHSYYTTPLGIVMRQDLFGDDTIFITPDAYTWAERSQGKQQARKAGKS